MNKEELKTFIRNNPVFWSRLGFAYDPPLKNEEGKPLVFTEDLGKYGKYHRDFQKLGVKIHTCILHLGWMGVDEYDYSLTDRVVEEIFKDNPDAYFIPRIKMNVPIDWCLENPEDVFVYYGGPDTVEGIKSLVGTLKQDYIGYEAPNGYYMAGDYTDTRPNLGGLIARQSFTSKKWLEDAGRALEKLLDRLENGPYADRIIGYHVAYGVSGECVLWGRASNRYGDYGIGYKKAFYEWGLKKYGSLSALEEAWQQSDIAKNGLRLPTPQERYDNTSTVDGLFRKDACDVICTDSDIFISEVNSRAIEHFGKIIKDKTGGKLVGAFYGYFIHINNPGYTGHLDIERLLASPYVDFFAAPKSYYRNEAGEAGGVMTATQSINRRKLWLDELDNRTHLARGTDAEWTSGGFLTTQTVFWREFSKNIASDSGFWWMDLGGGWFDSKEVMDEFASLVKANDFLNARKHESVADVLVLVDEECIKHMGISADLRRGFMEDFLRELNTSGVLVDMYRLSDLKDLALSQYKLIVFAYTFAISGEAAKLISSIPKDKTLLFNYAAGVIGDAGVDLANVEKLTGIALEEVGKGAYDFPDVCVKEKEGLTVLFSDALGVRVAQRGKSIANTKPYISASLLREISVAAGCHVYVPSGNTVYGDNRFLGVFSSLEAPLDEVQMQEKATYVDLISGKTYENTDKIPLSLAPKSAAFLLKK